jgi:hypothetical protein
VLPTEDSNATQVDILSISRDLNEEGIIKCKSPTPYEIEEISYRGDEILILRFI